MAALSIWHLLVLPFSGCHFSYSNCQNLEPRWMERLALSTMGNSAFEYCDVVDICIRAVAGPQRKLNLTLAGAAQSRN